MQGIEISIINVGTRRDIALFRVKGYIDTQTCTEMLTKITSVLQKGTYHLIIDMSQVTLHQPLKTIEYPDDFMGSGARLQGDGADHAVDAGRRAAADQDADAVSLIGV